MPTPYVREVYVHRPDTPAPGPRFIPTYVGFTLPTFWSRPRKKVHPHARGVYQLSRDEELAQFGPSPRTWGLRMDIAAHMETGRSIPTHVGFTMMAL